MKTAILFTTLAIASSVAANLHTYAWCKDTTFSGINEGADANTAATEKACAAYRKRNTGTNQWDTCPDCLAGYRGDVRVCNSPAKHIGGDEFQYYCQQNGADYSGAS